ncbi:hypothetical protein NZ698_01270 [Chryseobacterium sp. PBS4-4]|uniref:Right-handed parallel beta-helix repeat-containing protein n=1 Tax=Chryseobacterium edaphi TaxID=2976532 RepID=A0ABT2W394_9FLAO|nr:hypothetical protein [Chryseobacterium edaphi]MCU7615814.1 hypothetical protein [Chryseobacterium edaphi]
MIQNIYTPKLYEKKFLKTASLNRLFLMLFLFIGSTLSAADIYLTNGNQGNGSGSSFANGKDATTYLNALLTTPAAAGTHIYITGGVNYNIPVNYSGILLNNDDILIKGGYNPSTPYNYDPTTYITTFSGYTGVNGTAYAMFTSNTSTAKNVTVQGLKLVNGYANNVVFGAITFTLVGKFTFKDITITNQTTSQSLFYLQRFDNSSGNSSLTLDNCYFADNSSTTSGGAVINDYNHSGSGQIPVTINNSRFVRNTSSAGQTGGAIDVSSNSKYVVTYSTFCENNSLGYGGAINMNNASATIQITGDTFTNNYTRVSSSYGGAIMFTRHSTATITDTGFYGNYLAAGIQSNGGAIGHGSSNSGSVTISNSVFYNNRANADGLSFGGAISTNLNNGGNNGAVYSISNSKFISNKAGSSYRGGAIVYSNGSSTQLILNNNIFYDNTANGSTTINGADITAYNGLSGSGKITGSGNTVQNASGSYLSYPNDNSALPFSAWTGTIYNNNTTGNNGGITGAPSGGCPSRICNVGTMTPIFN